MLVVNTEARHQAIGHHHVLNPGVNDVPDETWAECKKIELVRELLKSGHLKEVRGAKGKPVTDLAKMKPEEAVELVKQTVDLELLSTWRSNSRGQLAKAIDEQVAELKKKPDTE